MEKSQRARSDIVDSTAETTFAFEGTDFKGRIVCLPQERWDLKILEAHPDLRGYKEAVKLTALDPDLVLHEQDLENIEIHATYDMGTGLYAKKYLWVPIRYEEERGTVLSAYWVPTIKARDYTNIEWRRK